MSEQGSTSVRPGFSPLDVVADSFQVLTREPAPLELFSTDVGGVAPLPRLKLDEMQVLLLDPVVDCGTRDCVWRALVARARSQDPAWIVGAAGVALPRLRRVAEQLIGDCAADRLDVEAAVLSGFVAAVRTEALEPRHVEQRLLLAAHRAGAWRVYAPAVTGSGGAGERVGVRFRAVLPDAVTAACLFA